MLKLKSRTYWEIDVSKIEQLIRENFNFNHEIVSENELHNGESTFFNITGEDHTKDIEKTKNGRQWQMGLSNWLEQFIFMKIMPKGNYIVDHSW